MAAGTGTDVPRDGGGSVSSTVAVAVTLVGMVSVETREGE